MKAKNLVTRTDRDRNPRPATVGDARQLELQAEVLEERIAPIIAVLVGLYQPTTSSSFTAYSAW
jgi:hypothetical protein